MSQAPRIAAVLAYRHDGFGARLMCLGNGIRFAKEFGCGFGFIWSRGPCIADIQKPKELFDVKAMAEKGVNFTNFANELSRSADARVIFNAGFRNTINMAEVPPGSTLLITCHRTLRTHGESDMVARKALSAALKLVVPTSVIAERISAFVRSHDLGSAIGVHVRRGDIVNSGILRHTFRVIELARYFAMVDVNRTSDEIFLCTEDASVIDAFEARYPKRVIRFPTRSWCRDDKNAVEDAFIEIAALSRTSFVIAGKSAFNRAATGLGFIPLLTITNTESGDPLNFANAAEEFKKFGMLERTALNLAACQSPPEADRLTATRKGLEVAVGALKG